MKIMVIDGNSIINRAYHGIRPLSNHEGTPTNAVYGFLSTLFKQQDEERPDRTVVCFDVKEKTFRHLKFDTYKATRKPMDEELAVQMPIVKEVLDALGIVRCELAGYEADDLLGTISRRANENGDECVILTGDRDSLQLVGGGTVVRLVKSALGKTTYTSYTPEKFRDEYGFDPIRLIDLKALMGDSSDNIPGVKGVGEKGARQLLADFGTLDGIYEHIDDERIKKGVRAKLQADEQGARDSYWLATIDRNVPLELDVAHLPEQKIDREALYSLLTRLEFDQFIRKLGLTEGGEAAAPRLPALKSDAPRVFSRTPMYSDFDVNGHVNNTKYIAWLCDALGLEAFDGAYIGDLVAGYEKEIRGHAPLKLTLAREGDSFSFQIASEAGEKHFVAGGMLRPEV